MSTTATLTHRQNKSIEAKHSKEGWLRRVGYMALLWLVIGAVVGASVVRPGTGTPNLLAGVVAGMIVLGSLGILLGLIGGRWNEAAVGAASGQSIGLIAGVLGVTGGPVLLTTTGLIFGALVGSTIVGVFYRLPRLIFRHFPVAGS
jgi:hypothetical protein